MKRANRSKNPYSAEIADDPDLKNHEGNLAIDENDLENELRLQPDLFYLVAKKYGQLLSQRDAAKEYVNHAEAEADQAIREDAAESGEKITETAIKAKIVLHPLVVAATATLIGCNHALSNYTALRDAYQQRSYALKDLVNLHVANYYSASTDMRVADTKADMARQRRERR